MLFLRLLRLNNRKHVRQNKSCMHLTVSGLSGSRRLLFVVLPTGCRECHQCQDGIICGPCPVTPTDSQHLAWRCFGLGFHDVERVAIRISHHEAACGFRKARYLPYGPHDSLSTLHPIRSAISEQFARRRRLPTRAQDSVTVDRYSFPYRDFLLSVSASPAVQYFESVTL
jgi:hypothetical protein